MKKDFLNSDSDQLNELVKFVKSISQDNKNLLLLSGEMGTGKTTFVSEFCKQYGFLIQSPTYSLIQEYKNQNICLAHVDLYRLENEDHIISSGFWDLFSRKYNFVFVEWSNRVSDSDWPLDWNIINLNFYFSKNERMISVSTNSLYHK